LVQGEPVWWHRQKGISRVKKSEVISRTLEQFWNEPSEDGDTPLEEVDPTNPIVAALEAALRGADPDTDIRTCEDFSHLQVECCDTCHHSYPHYDMALVDLESGDNAWICCAMDVTLNPGKHPKLKNPREYVDLSTLLGGNEPDAGS
jgi:hypothetical protein